MAKKKVNKYSLEQEIRSAMALKDKNAIELSKTLGISQVAFSQKLNAKSNWTIKEATILARELEIDVSLFYKL